jgi:hypothetical protein
VHVRCPSTGWSEITDNTVVRLNFGFGIQTLVHIADAHLQTTERAMKSKILGDVFG